MSIARPTAAGYDQAVGLGRSDRAAMVALGLLVLVAPSAARGDEVPYLRLAYDVGDVSSCPDERYLRDALTSRMGYDPVRADGKGSVEVHVAAASGRGLTATVTFQAEASANPTRRELAAKDGRCVDLVQAVAVTLAVLIDPFGEHRERGARAAAERSAAPPPPSAPEPAPATPVTSRPAAPDVPPAREPVRLEAWGVGLASLGLVPELGVGGAVGATARRGGFAFGASARAETTPSEVALGRGRVDASLLGGGLEACFAFAYARACATGAMGSYAGRDETVTSPVTRRALYAQVGLRAAVRVPIVSRLGLLVFAEGAVPVTRPELVVDGEVVHRTSPITGTLGLGPSFEVPGW